MFNFLKNIFSFIILGVVVYLAVLILWGEFMPDTLKKNISYSLGAYGHMYTRIREVEKYNNIDIVFMGSSHTYRGFDTRIVKEYGYESFNLGSSAQTPLQTKLLLEKYMDTLKPKTVVYEVCAGTFTNDGVEASMDMIANGKIDNKLLKMAFDLNNVKVYNSLVYGYYRQLLQRDKNFKENIKTNEDTYIPGGYLEKKMMYNNSRRDTNVNKEKWDPKEYQLTAFEKIVAMVKAKGVQLILVQAPVTKSEYTKQADNDKIDTYFSSKATYYNFNNLLSLSDSLHFYNNDHLNKEGVKIFNKKLFEIIAKK